MAANLAGIAMNLQHVLTRPRGSLSLPCRRKISQCGAVQATWSGFEREVSAPISLKAMECCQSSIRDFCKSHFIFHGLDPNNPDHLFRYLPLFMFIESHIYQVDMGFEKILHIKTKNFGTKSTSMASVDEFYNTVGDPMAVVKEELMKRNLLTERVSEECSNTMNYWRLEQSLCLALCDPSAEISISEVLHTMRTRSADYRLLNFLLYGLTGNHVNEAHVEFLSSSNYLIEIMDDMFDYEKDILQNTFNIVRMFSRVHGSKASEMLASHIYEAKQKFQRLFSGLSPELQEKFPDRELIIREGTSLSQLWKIPNIITNEDAFRRTHEEVNK